MLQSRTPTGLSLSPPGFRIRALALQSDPDPEVLRGSIVIWLIGCSIMAFVLVGVSVSDFTIDTIKSVVLPGYFALIAGGAAFVRVRLHLQSAALLVEAFAQYVFMSIYAVLASYLLASLGAPLQDETLAAWDRMIGISWPVVAEFVYGQPSLVAVLTWAYGSFVWQLFIVIIVLSLSGSHRRLQVFLTGWGLALVAALAVFAVAPAKGAFIHYGLEASKLPAIAAYSGWSHYQILEPLRIGELRELLSISFDGLVTFPSFHAASAILYSWAFWRVPMIRWLALVLNALMIVSTPVVGAHYIVDVWAGLALGGAAIWLAKGILPVAVRGERAARPIEAGNSTA